MAMADNTMRPVAWFEAEETTRGAALRDIINSIVHSTRWHWQAETPKTTNPTWAVYDAAALAAARAEGYAAGMTRAAEIAAYSDDLSDALSAIRAEITKGAEHG
jgi:hypothetical protein